MAVHPILSIFRERGDNLEKTDSSEYVPKNDLFHPIGGGNRILLTMGGNRGFYPIPSAKPAYPAQWGDQQLSLIACILLEIGSATETIAGVPKFPHNGVKARKRRL